MDVTSIVGTKCYINSDIGAWNVSFSIPFLACTAEHNVSSF